jgi:hypothetical protein
MILNSMYGRKVEDKSGRPTSTRDVHFDFFPFFLSSCYISFERCRQLKQERQDDSDSTQVDSPDAARNRNRASIYGKPRHFH